MAMATDAWLTPAGSAAGIQRQNNQIAVPCNASNNTVKAGTRNRSNWSRDRRAEKLSASANNAEPPLAFLSSSNSMASSRSRASSRNWKVLTAATRKPIPRKMEATNPAMDSANRANTTLRAATVNRASQLIRLIL